LKISLYDHAKDWIEKISLACKNLSGKKLNGIQLKMKLSSIFFNFSSLLCNISEFHDYTVKNIKDLAPDPGTLEDLQQAIHLHKTYTEEISSKELEIEHVRSLFALLGKADLRILSSFKTFFVTSF
jgi:hypothetical protein